MTEMDVNEVKEIISLIHNAFTKSKKFDSCSVYSAFTFLIVSLGNRLNISKAEAQDILSDSYENYKEFRKKQDANEN